MTLAQNQQRGPRAVPAPLCLTLSPWATVPLPPARRAPRSVPAREEPAIAWICASCGTIEETLEGAARHVFGHAPEDVLLPSHDRAASRRGDGRRGRSPQGHARVR
jgi:hypothetical protein